MEKSTFERLKYFLSEETGQNINKIFHTSKLEDDLGITGDDGIDLLNKYSTLFKVDISDLNFEKYFYPEPSIFNKNQDKITDLTVQKLYDAIEEGKLI